MYFMYQPYIMVSATTGIVNMMQNFPRIKILCEKNGGLLDRVVIYWKKITALCKDLEKQEYNSH